VVSGTWRGSAIINFQGRMEYGFGT
jgi:hypothetical protein